MQGPYGPGPSAGPRGPATSGALLTEKPEGTAAISSLEVSVLPWQLPVLWLRFTVTVVQLVL